ncbi:ferredoxin reductase family protein [Kaarinaea lacus]
MSTIVKTSIWIGVYLILVLAPLFVLLIGPAPAGAGFWWDFAMALGFTAMAMMGVQFFLTARFRHATAPFGIDIIYYFHRYLAILAISFLFVHYLVIRLKNPAVLGVLDPFDAPGYMTAGRLSVLIFVLIIVTSLWRKQLHIHYDEWRMLHIGLSVTGFLLALAHIVGAGYYITSPDKRVLWTGYTLFWFFLILYVRLIKPWRMLGKPWRVTNVQQACCNSWTLSLKPDGHDGMPFKAGQFAWLTLNISPFHVKEHPFSISSSASQPGKIEFTIKELGDFTSTIGKTKVGDIAYLDGPYGIFTVDRYPAAPGFVFIAGGIGAAPVMGILRTLADRKEQRPLVFLYSNNHEDEIIFRQELESLKKQLNLTLVHVVRDPSEDWQGRSGFITEQLLRETLPEIAGEYHYFLCGPKPMSEAVQRDLHAMRISSSHIHFELFDMV